MTTRSRIIGLAIVVLMVGWALEAGGRLAIFVDIPSALFVFGVLIGGLWACFGPGLAMQAFRRGLTGGGEANDLHVAVMARGYQLSWGAGLVGTLVGLVIILQNMDDPSKIGPGMAVGLLTVLYGAFLAEFVFGVLHQSLLNQDGVTETSRQLPRSVMGKAAAATIAALVMFMIILIALPQ
jgi:hypothetical protein